MIKRSKCCLPPPPFLSPLSLPFPSLPLPPPPSLSSLSLPLLPLSPALPLVRLFCLKYRS